VSDSTSRNLDFGSSSPASLPHLSGTCSQPSRSPAPSASSLQACSWGCSWSSCWASGGSLDGPSVSTRSRPRLYNPDRPSVPFCFVLHTPSAPGRRFLPKSLNLDSSVLITPRLGQESSQQQQAIPTANWCSIVISQENRQFIVSAVVGLVLLFGLVTYTDLPPLTRLLTVVTVALVAQWVLKSVGQ
jgi:hypothetical protein